MYKSSVSVDHSLVYLFIRHPIFWSKFASNRLTNPIDVLAATTIGCPNMVIWADYQQPCFIFLVLYIIASIFQFLKNI